MLTVHHLETSRSQRILWLLEELGVPYELRRYQRDPKTRLAPPELKRVHPLGKSPVITEGDTVVAESGAIIEYLAERFGPLDGYADGLRSFTRMYIIGASFWDVNWPQAVNYFRQVVQFAPNLRDASNVTASQRLYQALLKYGDQLAGNAKIKDRCVALDVWNEARALTALDNDYSYKFNQLDLECNPPTEVPTEIPPEVPTDTPPIVVPTDSPTSAPVEPSATPSAP